MKYRPAHEVARLPPSEATARALQEFHDFQKLWVPEAVREQVWDRRNNPVTSMQKAIRSIAPPEKPPVGFGVFSRVYDVEKRERIEYVRVTPIYEDPAVNALEYCQRKQPGDDFVICELRHWKRSGAR
jgi:hypothetical protein